MCVFICIFHFGSSHHVSSTLVHQNVSSLFSLIISFNLKVYINLGCSHTDTCTFLIPVVLLTYYFTIIRLQWLVIAAFFLGLFVLFVYYHVCVFVCPVSSLFAGSFFLLFYSFGLHLCWLSHKLGCHFVSLPIICSYFADCCLLRWLRLSIYFNCPSFDRQ